MKLVLINRIIDIYLKYSFHFIRFTVEYLRAQITEYLSWNYQDSLDPLRLGIGLL